MCDSVCTVCEGCTAFQSVCFTLWQKRGPYTTQNLSYESIYLMLGARKHAPFRPTTILAPPLLGSCTPIPWSRCAEEKVPLPSMQRFSPGRKLESLICPTNAQESLKKLSLTFCVILMKHIPLHALFQGFCPWPWRTP